MAYGLIPEQEVLDSVNKNCAIAQASGLGATFKSVELNLQGVFGSNTKTKLRVLRQSASRLSQHLEGCTACHKGCHGCCHMAVAMPALEAEQIGLAIGVKSLQPVSLLHDPVGAMALDEAMESYMGVACPFLEDNLCSIYENRPMACRLHHNVSDFAILCDLEKNPGSDTPALNFNMMHILVVKLLYEGGFNDIRAYFPNGLKGG